MEERYILPTTILANKLSEKRRRSDELKNTVVFKKILMLQKIFAIKCHDSRRISSILAKWGISEVPLDFFRNIACKRISTRRASLPFSRVLSTVANTCPVGTRDTVIQAEADEYSRVALRCNESFEFIRTVVHRLFFATIASYVFAHDSYVFARNTEIRLPAARIISSFSARGERPEPFERVFSKKEREKINTILKQRVIHTNFFFKVMESKWKFLKEIDVNIYKLLL